MIEFLNDNAGAVQSIATFVLVGITGWYVKLTRGVAVSTATQAQEAQKQTQVLSDQLELQRQQLDQLLDAAAQAKMTLGQQRQRDLGRFVQLAEQIDGQLQGLPRGDKAPADPLRGANVWSDSELDELTRLAPLFDATRQVGTAVLMLRQISAAIRQLRGLRVDGNSSAILRQALPGNWNERVDAARKAVGDVHAVGLAQQVLTAGETSS